MPYYYVILIISFVIVIRMQIVCVVPGMVASFLKRSTGSIGVPTWFRSANTTHKIGITRCEPPTFVA